MTVTHPLPATPVFVPFRPGVVQQARSADELRERAARLLPEIAAGAAARERDRVMPYEWVRRIAEQGLYTFRVPTRFCGPGGSVRDVIRFVIDLATVDSNVAQSLRPGFGFIESLRFANDDDGREVSFVVPRDRPGLQLVDDFDAMGQRLTASGTTIFDRVEVRPDELRPPMARDRRTPIPALYQLFLAAVEAGIAKNAFSGVGGASTATGATRAPWPTTTRVTGRPRRSAATT